MLKIQGLLTSVDFINKNFMWDEINENVKNPFYTAIYDSSNIHPPT